MAFFEGYIVGLSLALLVGPVLFVLLQASLVYGWRAGVAVALGVLLSDIICVILCSYGISYWKLYQPYLNGLGCILLLGLGIRYLTQPIRLPAEKRSLSARSYIGFLGRGFAVNFINPIVFLIWIGIIGAAANKYSGHSLAYFLVGTLAAIGTTDILKAIFAAQIRPYLQPHYLRWLYRGIGAILFIFGLRLLYMYIVAS